MGLDGNSNFAWASPKANNNAGPGAGNAGRPATSPINIKRYGNYSDPNDGLSKAWSRPTTPAELGLRPAHPKGYSMKVAPVGGGSRNGGTGRGMESSTQSSRQWERANRNFEREMKGREEQHRRSYDKRADQMQFNAK